MSHKGWRHVHKYPVHFGKFTNNGHDLLFLDISLILLLALDY